MKQKEKRKKSRGRLHIQLNKRQNSTFSLMPSVRQMNTKTFVERHDTADVINKGNSF